MFKCTKRLRLSSATLRNLTEPDLRQAAGGQIRDDTLGLCTASRGFSHCATICLGGGACGTGND